MSGRGRVWIAKDELTSIVANAIEERLPGKIVAVEVDVPSMTKLKRGEYDSVGDDFIIEVTAGRGPGKVKQVVRIVAENPTARIAVFAPNPEFNPIARADLESIANRVDSVRVLVDMDDLVDWPRSS